MTWLVLYPGPVLARLLQLYIYPDMTLNLLLGALAALNFLTCFLTEVGLLPASEVFSVLCR